MPKEGFIQAGEKSFNKVALTLTLDKIETINENAFASIGYDAGSEPFIVPPTVKSIGSNAFTGNTFRYIIFEPGTEANFDSYGSTIFGTSTALVTIPPGTYAQAANMDRPLNPYSVWDGTPMPADDYSIDSNGLFKQLYRTKTTPSKPDYDGSSSYHYYYYDIAYKYDYKQGGMIIPNGAKILSAENVETDVRSLSSGGNERGYAYVGAIAELPLRMIVFPPSFTDFGARSSLTTNWEHTHSGGSLSTWFWGTMRGMNVYDLYFTNKTQAPIFREYAFSGQSNMNWSDEKIAQVPTNPISIKTATLHVPEDPTVCQKYKNAVKSFFGTYFPVMVDQVVCDVTDEMIENWYN
jgi:hypothetical protein